MGPGIQPLYWSARHSSQPYTPALIAHKDDLYDANSSSAKPKITTNDAADPATRKRRTTGQHAPLFQHLAGYSAFPREVSGRTLWHAEALQTHPERWTHRLTPSQQAELGAAADAFLASGAPLAEIDAARFPLPSLAPLLAGVRDELLNGRGFVLFKGFPVGDALGRERCAVAYMGLGAHLGYCVSQNASGHVLGHVKNLGDDASELGKVRIYRTNARQAFHTDECDIVGLLCLARARQGGDSSVVSAHAVYNALERSHPHVLKLLTQPIWYFDRKGETTPGHDDWIRGAVFYLEQGSNASFEHAPPRPRRVYVKWDPAHVTSLTRYSAGPRPRVPALSDEQVEAIAVLEATCLRLALHMVLDVGDVQFLSNAHVLHARTAYVDEAESRGRRHLLRLWLATPVSEGGWRLPFWDMDEVRRGGVQVGEREATVPLEAE